MIKIKEKKWYFLAILNQIQFINFFVTYAKCLVFLINYVFTLIFLQNRAVMFIEIDI